MDVARIRAELPSAIAQAYLNAGTFGPLPSAAHAAMAGHLASVHEVGRIGAEAFAAWGATMTDVRAAFATALDGDPEDMALTHSTTDGVNLVVWGLELAAGDEVVTTNAEHPGITAPLAELARRRGVTVRVAEPTRAAIAAELTPRTKLVALSHVLWTTGEVLPLPEIAADAHDHGALFLVDGAQSGGAIPLDMHATGADFYAVSGQKWLLGPQGTGALWVHPRMLEVLRPAAPSYFTYADGHVGPLRPGAARFDSGSLDPTVLAGFAVAMAWVEGLPGGRAAWLAKGAERAAAARGRLARVPGVQVHDPGGPCSGLIALRLERHESADAVAALAERDVLVRPIPDTPFVRVSAGAWTDESDIEALAAGLEALG